MGVVSHFRQALRAELGVSPVPPDADFWYGRPGYASDSGMRVSPETAMRISAVFSCVRVVSETLGSLPIIIYQRLPNGGKRRAVDHPLYALLHNSPNQWQSGFEWVEMMQGHLELRGNAFSLINPGPKGAIESLVPIHPDRVQVYRLESGRLRYQVRAWYDGSIKNYAQEEMLHLRGLSSDGLVGMSTVAVAREPIGTGLALQEYAARFFANDAQPRGLLEHPGTMSAEAYKRAKESFQESQAGRNRHKTAILEEGLKYTALSMNNKDSQFLEARQFSRTEIASLFRVPLHKIGDLTKATFSNIEQQSIEFVTDCIRPRAVRWERRISMDLLDPLELGEPGEYFAEFLMDALLRGDLKSRYDAYAVGRSGGWLSPNDICEMENRNPISDAKGGNEYLRPANTTLAGAAAAVPGLPPAADNPDPPEDPETPEGARDEEDPEDDNAITAQLRSARLREFVLAAGERVARKEATALRKAYTRASFDELKFRAEVDGFYSTHPAYVSETMKIPIAAADKYVATNRDMVRDSKSLFACFEWIECNAAEQLAQLALGVSQ